MTSCSGHPLSEAVAHCSLCRSRMCDVCFDHLADGAPACTQCSYEIATRRQRAVSLALTIAGLGVGMAVWATRAGKVSVLLGAAGAAGAFIIALGCAILVRSGKAVEIEKRDRERPIAEQEDSPSASAFGQAAGHPYRRQQVRHVAMRMMPKVSGAGVTVALIASFALAALLFPSALHLPRWIEVEVVIAICWVAMTLAMAFLLYRGHRLRDDFIFVPPWRRLFDKKAKASGGGTSIGTDGCSSCGDPGCGSIDGEGIILIIVVVIAALLFAGAAWIIVEIALPVVVFAIYSLVLAALKHVAHDRHGCEQNVMRSLGWGALWSALFIAPLGAVVAVVHYAMTKA